GYLRDLTGTTVVSEPYPAGLLPDLTLTVELDVLDGRRNDSVRLRGRYRLRSPQGLSFHDVLLEEPVTGDTFSDVTAAYGKLLAALATRIHQDALIKLQ
ncbi:MAG: ABC-type transport auxiliary lipoprotein family protein, partial [Myxococcota bacterium]